MSSGKLVWLHAEVISRMTLRHRVMLRHSLIFLGKGGLWGTQVTKSLRGVADCPFWDGCKATSPPRWVGGSTPPALDPPVPIVAGEAARPCWVRMVGVTLCGFQGWVRKSDEASASLAELNSHSGRLQLSQEQPDCPEAAVL